MYASLCDLVLLGITRPLEGLFGRQNLQYPDTMVEDFLLRLTGVFLID